MKGLVVDDADLIGFPQNRFQMDLYSQSVRHLVSKGPKNVEADVPIPNVIIAKNGIAINPLNWKLDETYAPASMNLGSIVGDEKTGKTEIRDIDGDAQVCIARGTVVTNAKAIPNEMVELTKCQTLRDVTKEPSRCYAGIAMNFPASAPFREHPHKKSLPNPCNSRKYFLSLPRQNRLTKCQTLRDGLIRSRLYRTC